MSDQLYRTLIEGGSGSRETNALLNLINHETDIDKIVLYVKDSHEVKYQFLTNQQKNTGLKHFNDTKTFTECSNNMDNIYWKIDEYNTKKKRKKSIVFDDVIADMLSNKIRNSIVTELFIRGTKTKHFS